MSRKHHRGWRGPQRRPKRKPTAPAPVAATPVPVRAALTPRQVEQDVAMREYIGAERARLERQAELDWLLERSLAGSYTGPMLAEMLGGDG